MSEEMRRLVTTISMGSPPASDVVGKNVVDGLGVSTVLASDVGYETAILDAERAHPVERYDSEEDAVAGHGAWCKRVKGLQKVTELGYGELVEDEIVELVRPIEEGRWAGL